MPRTRRGDRLQALHHGSSTLELGGNDAAIVLDDVNPKEIAPELFAGATSNSGQPFVNRREPDRNECRACARHLPARQSGYQSNFVGAALFQPVDRGDGRVRRCQHRRDHDHQPLVQIARRLEEIFHGDEGLRFAVKPDVSDPSGRHQIDHALRKGHAGPQHRHEYQLLARDLRRLHLRKRRLDIDIGQR